MFDFDFLLYDYPGHESNRPRTIIWCSKVRSPPSNFFIWRGDKSKSWCVNKVLSWASVGIQNLESPLYFFVKHPVNTKIKNI